MSERSERIFITAPIGRDAQLMASYLEHAGLSCVVYDDMASLSMQLSNGAGALLITEEALTQEATQALAAVLQQQPPWSEIPIIILTGMPELDYKARSFYELGRLTNVTIIDRPVRIKSLVSAAQAALSARLRQYDVRDLMLELEERVHERDRFLAILGHELRNPLGAILMASQMIDPETDVLTGEHARLIERQSRHLTRLVNDLLDLSRVASGKIVLKTQTVDLRQIAAQSVQVMQEALRAQGVTMELCNAAEPLRINADSVRVDQIITNVLSNAIKYTPEGGNITVSLERCDQRACIRVGEDGVGIAPERIGTIFELFAQAENAIGRAQGGMGIGLALVRNLLQLHGGTITAKSEGVGKGSEFVIEFPLATLEQMIAPPAAPERDADVKAGPRRILIIEDNADVRDLLRLKLRRLGHEVAAVGDGLSGVDAILDSQPDLVLVDIGLPGIDGYEVATRTRKALGDGIVLVAVSGFGLPEDKRKAAEAGFDEHITKPADVHDIEAVLARFPPKRGALQSLGTTAR